MTTSRIRGAAVAGFAAVAVLAAACGGDDALEPQSVTITGVDFGYEDVPDKLAAGSDLTLQNASDVELHEIVVLRVSDDETRSIDEIAQLPPEELDVVFAAPPTAVLIAPPGEASFPAVGTGVVDEPGRYALVCFIPTGADPAEYLAAAETSDGPPDVAGGPPHFVNGIFAELTIEALGG